MCCKLTKTLASVVSVMVVVVSLAMAQSSKKGGLDDTITYEQGVVTTTDKTGMATVQTDRGVQYVVLGKGLKVGDKMECTTKEGQTACDKVS
jgi:hypothetical protein